MEANHTSILLGVGLVVLTLILFLTLFAYAVYSGALTGVEVGAGKPPIRNVVVAYKFGVGAYQNTGAVFTQACSLAPKLRMLGVYYDSPEEVEEAKLRWAVGSILAEGTEEPDPELIRLFKEEEFQLYKFPEVSNVVRTAFPHVTVLSIFIGIYKVYPRIGAYIKENKLCAYPMVEVYDGDIIHYMAPLSKQDEFFVPECDDDYDPEYKDELERAQKLLQEDLLEQAPGLLEEDSLEGSDEDDEDYIPEAEPPLKREDSLLRQVRRRGRKQGKKERDVDVNEKSHMDIPVTATDASRDPERNSPGSEGSGSDQHDLEIIPDTDVTRVSKEPSCSSSVPSMVGAAGKTSGDKSGHFSLSDSGVTSSGDPALPSGGDSHAAGSEASTTSLEPTISSSGLVSESSVLSFSSLSSDSASSDDVVETSSFEELKLDELPKKE